MLLDIAYFIPKKDCCFLFVSYCFALLASGFQVFGKKYCGVCQFILLKFMGFSEYLKRVEVIFALYPYLGHFNFTHIKENHFGNTFASHRGGWGKYPDSERIKSLKQVVTVPFPNIQQPV